MGLSLSDLNPSNWSIGGNSLDPLYVAKQAFNANNQAIESGLKVQEDLAPGYQKWKTGHYTGGLTGVQDRINAAAGDWLPAIPGAQRLGVRQKDVAHVGEAAALAAAVYFGGEALAGGLGAGSAAGTVGTGGVTETGTGIYAGTADTSALGDLSAGSAETGITADAGAGTAVGTTGAGTGTGAATKAGMSTAQKIALGLMGANTLLGGKPQPLNPTLAGAAAPSQAVSNSILAQYQSGQLNAADQYSIAKWAQDTKASKQAYYAKAGLADSSMAQQDIAQVDAQAGAMRDQALQNMLQGGLNAAGIANSALGNAVQLQMQQDQQAQQAQQEFFGMLAMAAIMMR